MPVSQRLVAKARRHHPVLADVDAGAALPRQELRRHRAPGRRADRGRLRGSRAGVGDRGFVASLLAQLREHVGVVLLARGLRDRLGLRLRLRFRLGRLLRLGRRRAPAPWAAPPASARAAAAARAPPAWAQAGCGPASAGAGLAGAGIATSSTAITPCGITTSPLGEKPRKSASAACARHDTSQESAELAPLDRFEGDRDASCHVRPPPLTSRARSPCPAWSRPPPAPRRSPSRPRRRGRPCPRAGRAPGCPGPRRSPRACRAARPAGTSRRADVDLAVLLHGEDQRLVLHADRLGGRLGQVDVDALLHHRRGHHEDDQQHEHHVDERRDVDLGERLVGRRRDGPLPWLSSAAAARERPSGAGGRPRSPP